jgi:hypothetical protein
MKRILIALLFVILPCVGYAQLWSPILNSGQAINWSNSGVGGIPARTTNCSSLTSTATVSAINSALASCASGQTVSLAAGTYTIAGTINVPSNVTLRGAGANQTILNATGTGGGYVVALGSGAVSYNPTNITSGATAGSTSIVLASASGVTTNSYLAIAETNNSSFVSSTGSEGLCTWCDGWTGDSHLARGQIVQVTGVSGTTVTISPGLYSAYTNTPIAVPFTMSASYAGVENLQVHANNTGYAANYGLTTCAYCWVKGVESNYTDGDQVSVYWGYRDEIRDSYFSNAFIHTSGSNDQSIRIASKTSATLVENNILERCHVSIMFEWGAAGNVASYNYTEGELDQNSNNFVIGGIDSHGAHPQFNLLEGNVVTTIEPDSVWGTSSQITVLRNWVVGTNQVCTPYTGRGTVSCTGTYAFQAARAMDVSYLSTLDNFVGNVVGSTQAESMLAYGTASMTKVDSVEYPAARSYDADVYNWSFGYGEANDDGTGTGCSGGTPPCHLAGTSATDLLHGNYSNITGAITWATGVTHTLPPSFYLTAKPSWWGSLPYPAIGPDVTGGSGPGGHAALTASNPAQACFAAMGGTDGGAGSPYTFNAASCYAGGTPTASTPTFSPGTATYTSAQSVTISSATSGATIWYNTTGTFTGCTPSSCTGATQVTGAVTVASTQTLYAIATESGYTNSTVGSAAYTITTTPPTAATPTFSPVAGTYTVAQSVALASSTSGAAIYYTTNGTNPTTSSTLYAAPFSIVTTTTVKALAVKSGYNNSAVASALYTINTSSGSFTITINTTGKITITGSGSVVVKKGP